MVSESGLVTITGGKWTTYRRMAIDAVDHAAIVRRPSRAAFGHRPLKLHGCPDQADQDPGALAVYGSDAPRVIALFRERPEWNQLLHPSLPYRSGEVIWAARHEAARSVADVLARRTRSLFLDARASIEAAPQVAALLASELGKGPAWQDQQAADFRKLAAGYLVAPEACGMPSSHPEAIHGVAADEIERFVERRRGDPPNRRPVRQRSRLLDPVQDLEFPFEVLRAQPRHRDPRLFANQRVTASILPNEHAASLCMVERLDPALDKSMTTAPPCLTAERSRAAAPLRAPRPDGFLGFIGSSIPIQTSSASTESTTRSRFLPAVTSYTIQG